MGWTWNLRTGFLWITGTCLAASHLWTSHQLAETREALQRLRRDTAQLDPQRDDQLGVARVPLDEPDRWQLRFWLPHGTRLELQASTLWLAGAASPDWQSVLALPEGAALLTCGLDRAADGRRWELSLVLRHGASTTGRRLPLTEDQSARFPAGGRYWMSPLEAAPRYSDPDRPAPVLLEHLITADGTLLYGEQPPDRDQVGIYLRVVPIAGPAAREKGNP
jgi:hypothetical protein